MTTNYIQLVSKFNLTNPSTGGLGNLRQSLNSLPKNRILNILEVGCNTGVSTIAIGEMFPNAKVTGIDILPAMIERSKQNLETAIEQGLVSQENIAFEIADAEKLPFPNESFDLVVFTGSLSFINDKTKALIEANRVLKSSGFLHTTDYYTNIEDSLSEKVSDALGFDVRELTDKFWIELHSEKGFEFELVELKDANFNKVPISFRINSLKKSLNESGITITSQEVLEMQEYLELFQANEKNVKIVNLIMRKQNLKLFSNGASN